MLLFKLIVAFLYLNVSPSYFVIWFPLCLTFKDLVGTRDMSMRFLEIDILAPQLVHIRKEVTAQSNRLRACVLAGRTSRWTATTKKGACREVKWHPQVVRKTCFKSLEGVNSHKYNGNEAWQ